MDTKQETTTQESDERAADSALSASPGYLPRVGDRFVSAAKPYKTVGGETVKPEQQEVLVTMMSHRHVVAVQNGREFTMGIGEFKRLAESSIRGGAKLFRDNVEVDHE